MGLEAAIIRRSRNRALVNFLQSVENLTDLNNIPKPCPYLIIMSLLLSFTGVAEHWVNL